MTKHEANRQLIEALTNAKRRAEWAERWYDRFGEWPQSYNPSRMQVPVRLAVASWFGVVQRSAPAKPDTALVPEFIRLSRRTKRTTHTNHEPKEAARMYIEIPDDTRMSDVQQALAVIHREVDSRQPHSGVIKTSAKSNARELCSTVGCLRPASVRSRRGASLCASCALELAKDIGKRSAAA